MFEYEAILKVYVHIIAEKSTSAFNKRGWVIKRSVGQNIKDDEVGETILNGANVVLNTITSISIACLADPTLSKDEDDFPEMESDE